MGAVLPRTGGSGAKVKLRASAKGELWAGANSELPRPELKSWLPVKGVEPYVQMRLSAQENTCITFSAKSPNVQSVSNTVSAKKLHRASQSDSESKK